MKKVLVTGAAGTIGVHVIKYLLSEGKYEITALDLKNKRVFSRLKRFKKRINILYGDICDRVLVESLIKNHDIIIHLAGSSLPLADMKKGLADIIDYSGTENIIRAINYYNPKAHLFYASSTTLYKDEKDVTVKSKIRLEEYDYYNNAKYNAENLIKEKLKNYTIYRLPLILGNPKDEPFMYHGISSQTIECITKEDAAYAFVKGIDYAKELNRRIFNVTSGERLEYGQLLNKILSIYGISFKYILSRLFLEKNFYSTTCEDKDELNEIISYRTDTLNEYFNRLYGRSKKRKIQKMFGKFFIKDKEK